MYCHVAPLRALALLACLVALFALAHAPAALADGGPAFLVKDIIERCAES